MSWSWSSAQCPPAAPTLTLKSVSVSAGRRVFVWKFNLMTLAQTAITYSFAYRVDNQPWQYTADLLADLSGLVRRCSLCSVVVY